AGLADLHVVGHEACVDRGAGSADGSAALVGQGVQVLEVVTVAHAAAAGNDDLGSGQLRTVGVGQLFTDEGGLAGVVHGANGLDRGRATFGGHGAVAGGAHGDDLDASAGLHGGNGVTGVDRALEGVGGLDRDDLGDLVDVQQCGDARQDVLAVGGGRGQHVAVSLAQLGNQRGDVFRQQVGVGGVVRDQHLGNAGDLGGGLGNASDVLASDQHVDITTDLGGGSDSVQ